MPRIVAQNHAVIPAKRVLPGRGMQLAKLTSMIQDNRFRLVRAATLALSEPLSPEDYVVQSMPDASPAKWHLAHTTWFFEEFVLQRAVPGYKFHDEQFRFLFNSYYNTVGPMHSRPQRGLLSRPTVEQVLAYRARIDERMHALLQRDDLSPEILSIITLGLNHEQQHQELLLTDLKHLFSCNPLLPAYVRESAPHCAAQSLLRASPGCPSLATRATHASPPVAHTLRAHVGPGFPSPEIRATHASHPLRSSPALSFKSFDGGLIEIGHAGNGFSFDNELPRHRTYTPPFRLANRAVTNSEYLEFIRAGGYENPVHWLSDGWATIQSEGWRRPIYWSPSLDAEFTLTGLRELNPGSPVCHLSYYEADAFAHWAGARLPTEAEWELAANEAPLRGNFVENRRWHPEPPASRSDSPLLQMFGDVWEWTQSAYAPYPGFTPAKGALGEYNGKFMVNQLVLRGGSCATPASHIRATYRNFFNPAARWQFTGLRLAQLV